MERAYLIPQLINRGELLRCERLLCPCDQGRRPDSGIR